MENIHYKQQSIGGQIESEEQNPKAQRKGNSQEHSRGGHERTNSQPTRDYVTDVREATGHGATRCQICFG